MKICPLCHTKFDDSAEFCPHCKAELNTLDEAKKAEEQTKIPKSFWVALLGTFAFIVGMIVLYRLVAGLL